MSITSKTLLTVNIRRNQLIVATIAIAEEKLKIPLLLGIAELKYDKIKTKHKQLYLFILYIIDCRKYNKLYQEKLS